MEMFEHSRRAARMGGLFVLLLATLAGQASLPAVAAVEADSDRMLLLLDNSGSMRSNDTDRLVPAAVEGFIDRLPPGTRLGVISFDAGARLLQPLIPAGDFRPGTLDALDYRGQLTDPSAAVERALYHLGRREHGPGRTALILITDGVVDLGNPTASLRAEDWLLGDLLRRLQAEEIRVWAIALTEAADFRVLSQLTDATGGGYFRALDASAVATAIDRIGTDLATMAATVSDPPLMARTAKGPPAEASDAGTSATGTSATGTSESGTSANGDAASRTSATGTSATPASGRASPAPTGAAPAAGPGDPATGGPGPDARFWLALGLLTAGILMLCWVGWGTWRARRPEPKDPEPALEYFPECYLVDLEGITSRPTHMLSSKYNMVTRLQNPPEDGINYIQVFRRQIGRRHALIEYRDFSFWIIDQNSVNGTWLNGERILQETRLKHGDRLRFHVYEFEFCVSDLALSNETLAGQDRATSS
jgi:uncharacterized protein YegL